METGNRAHEFQELLYEVLATRPFENIPPSLVEALVRNLRHLTVRVEVREPAGLAVRTRVGRVTQLMAAGAHDVATYGEVDPHVFLPHLPRELDRLRGFFRVRCLLDLWRSVVKATAAAIAFFVLLFAVRTCQGFFHSLPPMMSAISARDIMGAEIPNFCRTIKSVLGDASSMSPTSSLT